MTQVDLKNDLIYLMTQWLKKQRFDSTYDSNENPSTLN